jgi:hypothetical protein
MAPCDMTVDTGGEFPSAVDRPESGQDGDPCEGENPPADEFATSIFVRFYPSLREEIIQRSQWQAVESHEEVAVPV